MRQAAKDKMNRMLMRCLRTPLCAHSGVLRTQSVCAPSQVSWTVSRGLCSVQGSSIDEKLARRKRTTTLRVHEYIPAYGLYQEPSPEEIAEEKARLESGERRWRFDRNTALSDYYMDILQKSSIVFVTNGELTDTKARDELASLGFTVIRIKSSLLKIAAKKMAPNDKQHLASAAALSQGVVHLVFTKQPLETLLTTPKALDRLLKVLPLEKVSLKHRYYVTGSFMRDVGKTNENVWLTRAGSQYLLKLVKKSLEESPTQDITPHDVFHAKAVAELRAFMGAIRQPLTAPGSAVSSTLSGIPQNIGSVFAKIQAKREEESKN